jgi:glutaredoxin
VGRGPESSGDAVEGRPTPDAARVVVLVRDGCHLCDDAVAHVESVCSDLGIDWHCVDVDSDAELRAEFTDHVPVTFVDGVQFALWFLDPDALRAALVR